MAVSHTPAGLGNCLSASWTGRTCPTYYLYALPGNVRSGIRCQQSGSHGSSVCEAQASRTPVGGIVASFSSLLACGEAAAEGLVSEHVHCDSANNTAVAAILRGLPLAELDPDTSQLLIHILGPVFTSLNLLFILRIVMSWYPALPVARFPFVIAYAPTEPVLEPTRRLFRPVGGVDISPIIWVALISFLNEILLGQQGLLVLLSQERV